VFRLVNLYSLFVFSQQPYHTSSQVPEYEKQYKIAEWFSLHVSDDGVLLK